ncbi:hypothetical protein MTO96_021828 [Rhipicephalus appendiculatus]
MCLPAQLNNAAATNGPQHRQFRFVARLVDVPLVTSLIERVSRTHAEIRARSFLIAAPLAAANNAAAVVARLCHPFVRTSMGRPLEFVDALACQGLDKLQQCYPAAFQRPCEIAAVVTTCEHRKAEQQHNFALGKQNHAIDKRHQPHFNNVAADITLDIRFRTIVCKLGNLAERLSGHASYDDPTLATVQHAFLLIAMLIDRHDVVYRCFSGHILRFYLLWVTLPEPPAELYTPSSTVSEDWNDFSVNLSSDITDVDDDADVETGDAHSFNALT